MPRVAATAASAARSAPVRSPDPLSAHAVWIQTPKATTGRPARRAGRETSAQVEDRRRYAVDGDLRTDVDGSPDESQRRATGRARDPADVAPVDGHRRAGRERRTVHRRQPPQPAGRRRATGVHALDQLLPGVAALREADRDRHDRAELKAEIASTRAQLSSASANARIETEAASKLGLVEADPNATTYLRLQR